jgi:predicted nucleic-acid-binding Zn-ribbon protein
MNLRKLFNLPNAEQRKLLRESIERIEKRAEAIRDRKYDERTASVRKANETCPLCRNTQGNVNKIRRTKGSGNVYGSFLFGSGSLYGSSSLDTDEVNHCGKCGNEWFKDKAVWLSKDSVIADGIEHIYDDLVNGEERPYRQEERNIFNGEYAEVIPLLIKDKGIKHELYSWVIDNGIPLKLLRTKFPSVYGQQKKK